MKNSGNAPAAGTNGMNRGAGLDDGSNGAKPVSGNSRRIGTIDGRIKQSKGSVSSLPTGEWGYPVGKDSTNYKGTVPAHKGRDFNPSGGDAKKPGSFK